MWVWYYVPMDKDGLIESHFEITLQNDPLPEIWFSPPSECTMMIPGSLAQMREDYDT